MSSSAPSLTMSAVPPSSESSAGKHESDRQNMILLTRFQAGDEAAFEELFRRYGVRLATYAYRFVKSRELAAEIAQDVFLRLWERRDRIEIREHVESYLYHVTRNHALDIVRRDSLLEKWIQREQHEFASDLESTTLRTDALLEVNELAAAIQRAIDELPDGRRTVLLMRWRDGLRNREVADALGISVKTVENQITRALHTLHERLAPYFDR